MSFAAAYELSVGLFLTILIALYLSFVVRHADDCKLQAVQVADRVASGLGEFVLGRGVEAPSEEKDADDPSALLLALFHGVPPVHAHWHGGGATVVSSLDRRLYR